MNIQNDAMKKKMEVVNNCKKHNQIQHLDFNHQSHEKSAPEQFIYRLTCLVNNSKLTVTQASLHTVSS